MFESVADILYHGSPYKFDKFDSSKITNTIYGYGLYFSNNKEVAEGYGKEKIHYLIIDGVKYTSKMIVDNKLGDDYHNLFDALGDLSHHTEHKEECEKLINLLRNAKSYSQHNPYYVYVCEIMNDNFLEWGSPLKSKDIMRIIEQIVRENLEISIPDEWEVSNKLIYKKTSSYPISCQDFYVFLSKVLGTSKEASAFMKRCGYTGFKNTDSMVIVLDQQDVKIIRVEKHN